MTVEFFFDPICPWCWITSRWIVEVAPQRAVAVTWMPFSLYLKNNVAERERPEPALEATHRMLRVVAAVADSDPASVGPLYTELGSRIHHDQIAPANIEVADVLQRCGLDHQLAHAAEETSRDGQIRASMDRALALVGDDVGTPVISFNGAAGYFGPVMTPAPTGEAALRLFDSLAVLASLDGFYELKRTRDRGPMVGERPAPAGATTRAPAAPPSR